MLRNYIKTLLRNLLKNKLTSFINIFGLAVAIGCSMVVYVYINWELSMDDFHENADHVFYINNVITRSGETDVWGFTPAPLGPMIAQDFPQVERILRLEGRSAVMRFEDKVFNENVDFADPGFKDMFSFPVKWGSLNALEDESKIVLSEEISIKYFGEENPVGKQITLTFADNIVESFEVGGVLDKYPANSSIHFPMLVNYEKLKAADPEVDFSNWRDFIDATFVQLQNPADKTILEENMDKYISLQNEKRPEWPSEAYQLEPLTTLSINSHKVQSSYASGDEPTGRIVLGILGIFLLALAVFNYINIAIVSASKRLKEIGIRKVVGGNRKLIIYQFLLENLVVTLFALMIGVALGYFLFVPGFDNLFSIGFEFNMADPNFWLFFFVVLIITGLASGAYPAFYISSYKAVDIFRGNQRFGSKNIFTKVFLTFQFILALLLIVGGISFTQNSSYQKKRDWGYNQDQTLVVPVPDGPAYTQLKNEVSQNPDIISTAGSRNHIGRSVFLAAVEIENEMYEHILINVGENYMETMELRLKEGRFFNKDIDSDYEEAVMINQMAADNMKWEEPIGQLMIYDSTRYRVIGVLEDFHYNSFWSDMRPTIIRFTKEDEYRYLSLRVKAGSISKTEEYLQASWKELFPDLPYSGFFQDQVFDDYFNNVSGHGKLMSTVAIIAVILACMGLFGLVSMRIAASMKDFSIRKVLGAGIHHLVNGVNRQFMWVLLIAIVLGGPLSYKLVEILFEAVYSYYMPMTFNPVLIAVSLLLLTSLITVSTVIYKVVFSNPVDSLRTE